MRGGPRSYRLKMNGTETEAEIHTLRDGGLLMQARFVLNSSNSFSLNFIKSVIITT